MLSLGFRVWDKAYKKMIYPCQPPIGRWSLGITLSGLIPERFELMQCTGLKDKDGKDIYEGDVLSVRLEGTVLVDGSSATGYVYEPMVAKFVAGEQLGRFIAVDQYGGNWGGLINTEVEVIGNIHDNPELFKEDGE